MLDTLVLVIEIGDPKLQKIIAESSFDNWSPSLRGAFVPPFAKMRGSSATYCLNTTQQDKKLGVYTPRLTLYVQRIVGGYRRLLYVEFSAPKLLYGNNFTEIGMPDYRKLCDKLSMSLAAKGVNLSSNQLRYAEIKAVHFAKNIVFTDGTKPSDVIRYLRKAEVSLRKKKCETKYLNDGDALHIYTNSRGFCVYDKLRELEKAKSTEKGNLEKDSWCQQEYVKDFLITTPKPFEVLRIESRLLNRVAIVQELRALGCNVPDQPRLKDVYDLNVTKALLLSDLTALEIAMPSSVGGREPPDVYLAEIKRLNPGITPANVLMLLGKHIATDEVGVNATRKALGCTNRQWCDLRKRIASYKLPESDVEYFAEMRAQIIKFKLLNLDDYRGQAV